VYQTTVRVLATITLIGSLALASAAAPAIGLVSAGGSFRVDGARVSGNATLFEGTVIETDRTPSQLQLLHGARMILGADSRGKVYRDRVVLERGQAQIAGSGTFPIEAAALRVLATQPDSTALVTLDGARRLHVSALAGSVRVTNAEGILVANIAPGKALELEQQPAGAAAPSKLTGTLVLRDGHYLLTDETTGVIVELIGENLAGAIGKRVEVTGTLDTSTQPVAGAAQTIKVLALKVLGKSVAAGAATGAAGGAAKGAATAAATSTIAGVAATGATAGGAIAAVAAGGKEPGKEPISR